MDIKRYREFLFGKPENKEETFENKVLKVAKQMILHFDKAQKEGNEKRKGEIIFTNSCKENEDGKGFVMKIRANTYEFTYEEVRNSLSKSLLKKTKSVEDRIENTIFNLLETKRENQGTAKEME
ncbi:hypothetical protein R9X47_00210 [Wukongibacter baidiensis]|uniref:hypothetical protein n=1 Tax=Wukongibacter baidiensis TaxID=1723361 RepID=UPI003D7FE11E